MGRERNFATAIEVIKQCRQCDRNWSSQGIDARLKRSRDAAAQCARQEAFGPKVLGECTGEEPSSPQVAICEGVAGAGFRVALEFVGLLLVGKGNVGHKTPGAELRCVR